MVRANVKMRVNFYRGLYSSPNSISTNVVLGHLDLNFQCQTFETLASLKRWELPQTCRLRLLRTLTFAMEWRHWTGCTTWHLYKLLRLRMICLDANISETMRAGLKCIPWLLWMLIFAIEWHDWECCTSQPWTKFSLSTIWNVNSSENARANAKYMLYDF